MVKNKWRPFPLPQNFDFYKNPCLALRSNVLNVQDYTREYGLTDCPFPKGYYDVYNLYVDDADLPPHGIPFGKYKVTANAYEVNTPDGNILNGEYLADIVPVKGHH
ncbi:hypothetical protein ILUMI_19228 [Ignelater luminosus]|uniref:Uncharacterized protein n=1 Tax=Ignelater luminosus TaxID=2038154 RepID=A0A8K0CNI3_IGNLU|nr:hypothetical protein ILUMI_19228 [Ignelater luminosus]